jgi:hypothetical protein
MISSISGELVGLRCTRAPHGAHQVNFSSRPPVREEDVVRDGWMRVRGARGDPSAWRFLLCLAMEDGLSLRGDFLCRPPLDASPGPLYIGRGSHGKEVEDTRSGDSSFGKDQGSAFSCLELHACIIRYYILYTLESCA